MVGFTDKDRKHGEAALSGVRGRPASPGPVSLAPSSTCTAATSSLRQIGECARAFASEGAPSDQHEADLTNLILAWYHTGFFTAVYQERHGRR